MKTVPHPATSYSLLLGKIGTATAVAAAVALGVLRLADSLTNDADEMDATDYLLRNGVNRRRLLTAVERDKNRQFTAHGLL